MDEDYVSPPGVPSRLDVAAIRARMPRRGWRPCTQAEFAQAIGVPVGTLRQWEQGRRQPSGPARVLLALIDRAPGIVRDTLGARPGNEIPQGVGCRCLKRSGAPPRFTVLSPERA
jgi:DNA-binding transcriptional regulator YdaS (Cro superfamily)